VKVHADYGEIIKTATAMQFKMDGFVKFRQKSTLSRQMRFCHYISFLSETNPLQINYYYYYYNKFAYHLTAKF